MCVQYIIYAAVNAGAHSLVEKKKPRKNLCGGLDVSVIYSTLRIFDFRRAAAWQGNKEKSDEITKVSPGVSHSLPDAS